MTVRLSYTNSDGRQIMHDVASDGTDSTVYSEAFYARDSEIWSTQFEWDETTATYAAAYTLWASNKPNPDLADDTDWVEMEAGHGFSGLPGSDPSGGDGKDMVDFTGAGALWYRWKVVRATGAATLQAFVSKKDRR